MLGEAGLLLLAVVGISFSAPLAAAAVTMGVLTWTGVAWLARWIPRRVVEESLE